MKLINKEDVMKLIEKCLTAVITYENGFIQNGERQELIKEINKLKEYKWLKTK